MEIAVRSWVRWGCLALAIPQLITGVWAVFAPRSWFDDFPGFGPSLVGADPPFNRHLASDAGGGFLATGVALLIAVLWPRRHLVLMALAVYLVLSVPHAAFHAAHDSPGLSSGEDIVNVVSLFSGVGLASVLAWGAVRGTVRRPVRDPAAHVRRARPSTPTG